MMETCYDIGLADYQRQQQQLEMCHAKECKDFAAETRTCEGVCGERFCERHLEDGMCSRCFFVDSEADKLIEGEKAA